MALTPLVVVFLSVTTVAHAVQAEHSMRRVAWGSVDAVGESHDEPLHSTEHATGRVDTITVANNIKLFCYAFTRTPHEIVLHAFTEQLAAACDGWRVFSWKDDLRVGVLKAYTHTQERRAMAHHQQDMMLGAWHLLNDTGILKSFDWFLKVEPDTFLVPSRLKAAISRHPTDSMKPITQGVDTDGFFVAMSQRLLAHTIEAYAKHPHCVRRASFQRFSGVFLSLATCPEIRDVDMLADSDGDALVASFPDCSELNDETRRVAFAGSSKQRFCNRFGNTLLSCFEYGSSKDCSKQDVIHHRCGRRLSDDACVSSQFVALHPVTELGDFLGLAMTFK